MSERGLEYCEKPFLGDDTPRKPRETIISLSNAQFSRDRHLSTRPDTTQGIVLCLLDTVQALVSVVTREAIKKLGNNMRMLTEEARNASVSSFVDNNYPLIIGCALAGVVVVVATYCFCREWLKSRFGIRCCEGELDALRRRTREERQRILEDERIAMELQQEITEEEKKESIMRVRAERRRKYGQFLAPYTMVVRETDLVCPTVDDIGSRKGSGLDQSGHDIEAGDTDQHSEVCLDETSDLPKKSATPSLEVLLTHPLSRTDGSRDHVEGSCSICLLDYEVGDNVVFSTRRLCPHAFHDECIMMWLEKGKKRCPICRNFFVPGSAMDDKKIIEHDDNDEHAIEAHLFSGGGDSARSSQERPRSNTDATVLIVDSGDSG